MATTPSTTRQLIDCAATVDRRLKQIDVALDEDLATALPKAEDVEQLLAQLTIAATRLPALLARVATRAEALAKDADPMSAGLRLTYGARSLRNQGIIASWELQSALDQARGSIGRASQPE